MDTSKYKKLFLQEAEERLKIVNAGILNLSRKAKETQAQDIDNIFRAVHSIKGMAASMGYEAIKSLAHRIEGLLDGLRKGSLSANQSIVDTLLKGADMLAGSLNDISLDRPIRIDLKQISDEVEMHLKGGQVEKAVKPSIEPLKYISISSTIKVDAGVFDNAVSSIGNLLIIKSNIETMIGEESDIKLAEDIHRLEGSVSELYETIINARMIPLEDLMQGIPRIIYDISRAKGKKVELSILGADIKVDRTILDAIAEPLVHIIRNAIDHGIESPEERREAGKHENGSIKISAAREGGNVIIEINDDGRGIDADRIKEKAIAIGMTSKKLDGMNRDEILSLVCLPGLSLAKEVTDVSGRGVGMDIVKRNVEVIGGAIKIESTIGKGARFILKLPLTTSIIKVFMASLNNRLFCLPVSKIEAAIDVDSREINKTDNGFLFSYRDKSLEFLDLRRVFNMPFREPVGIIPVVIVNLINRRAGIWVDEFKGVSDAYIKPLPNILKNIRGISGFTIIGDGTPVFLLEVANMVQFIKL